MGGIVNTLLVRYATAHTEVQDAASYAIYGRKEGFLLLGGVQSLDEAVIAAQAALALTAFPRETTTMSIEPVGTGDEPYADFEVADFVTAPNSDGTSGLQRVVSLAVSEDENGEVTFAPELKSSFQVREEVLNQQLKRLVNGAMRGATAAASPILPPPENGRNGLDQNWLIDKLRARPESFLSGDDGIGTSGGTFDAATDQLLEIEWYVGTTCGASGVTTLTIPDGGFPTGLLTAVVTPAQPITQLPVMIVNPSACSKTVVSVLTRRSTDNTNYPSGDAIGFMVRCTGW